MEGNADILSLYKKSWEEHNENLLRLIFHPDAEYYDKPFKRPLQGIEEIVQYWRRNREVQRNTRFAVLREVRGDNQVIAEWRCEFDRIDLGEHVVVQGVLWASLKDNKISRLVEYFMKQE